MSKSPRVDSRRSRRPIVRRACAVAVLSLATTLLTPLAASAEQNYWAPANGELTLKGHGFGHGRGMSQYGAQGAAGQGLSWRQILSFYYPGTSLGQAAGQIRVLITDDQSSNVRVSAMGGTALRLRDLADGKAWVLRKPTASTDAWELNVNGQNQNIVRYHDRNGWKNWKVPGRGTLRGDAEFYSANPIELRTDRGRASYRGNLRMVKVGGTSSKRRDTVNVVGLENYVRGVVPDEMPASWRQPALAAQAVAARTYAVRHRGANPNRYYHVDDTISYQVYGGASAEDTRADRAISLTKGTIVTYGGAPALTEFSSSSGGWTAGSNLPYQVYKKDPYDAVSGNPNHTWQVKVRTSLLERAYPGIGTFERLRVLTMPGGGEFGGRVGTAELIGTKGSRKVTGDDLRRVLGLKSNWFRPLDTPIIKRWRAIGGWSSVLGAPQAREYVVAGGNGQAFKGGYMYHSAATGTHPVHGPVFREYRRLRGASGVLKLPTTDIVPTSDGAALRASFQAGVIYSHETLGTHGLYGPIERAYAARRWTVGPLGLPKSSVKPTTERDGHVAAFQHGAIYHRPDLGAHALYGPIYQAYASTGWTTGPLGMPSTGVGRTTALDAQRTSFVGGVIYYRRDVGAHALHGPIYDAYARQGWTTGYLGLPTTDVTVVPGGLRADFEHGWIMWDESTDRTTIHRSG